MEPTFSPVAAGSCEREQFQHLDHECSGLKNTKPRRQGGLAILLVKQDQRAAIAAAILGDLVEVLQANQQGLAARLQVTVAQIGGTRRERADLAGRDFLEFGMSVVVQIRNQPTIAVSSRCASILG